MKIRPFIPSDTEPLRLLWNRACPFDQLSPALFAENVLDDERFDSDLLLVAEDDLVMQGFAMAIIKDDFAVLKMCAVDPDFQGQKIATFLFRVMEELCRQKGSIKIRLGESAPNYLVPGIDTRYTFAWLFAESLDYRKFSETYNLSVDLSENAKTNLAVKDDIQRLAGQNIDIRRASKEDCPAFEAFLDRIWPAWIPEVEKSMALDPPAVHLALKDNQIVGFSGYEGNNQGAGWFGPMGTDPSMRGLSVGRVLLRLCLIDLQSAGHKTAIIPWVGPIRFYAKAVGAQIDRTFWRYEKSLVEPDLIA